MSCMVRGHADPLDRGNQRMFGDARVLGDHVFQDFGDHGLSSGRQKGLRVVEGFHRLVAGASRRKEHDGGGEVFLPKREIRSTG